MKVVRLEKEKHRGLVGADSRRKGAAAAASLMSVLSMTRAAAISWAERAAQDIFL